MKRIQCEMCSSNKIIKQEGVYICQNCGCKYSVEEAQRLLVDISGSRIEVEGISTIDQLLKNGDVQLEMGNYRSAFSTYAQITQNSPSDYRGWWGMVKSYTLNLNGYFLPIIKPWINSAVHVATRDQADHMKKELMSGKEKLKERTRELIHSNNDEKRWYAQDKSNHLSFGYMFVNNIVYVIHCGKIDEKRCFSQTDCCFISDYLLPSYAEINYISKSTDEIHLVTFRDKDCHEMFVQSEPFVESQPEKFARIYYMTFQTVKRKLWL